MSVTFFCRTPWLFRVFKLRALHDQNLHSAEWKLKNHRYHSQSRCLSHKDIQLINQFWVEYGGLSWMFIPGVVDFPRFSSHVSLPTRGQASRRHLAQGEAEMNQGVSKAVNEGSNMVSSYVSIFLDISQYFWECVLICPNLKCLSMSWYVLICLDHTWSTELGWILLNWGFTSKLRTNV